MAEVIGSVAAVAQLTVQLVETTQKLVRYTRKIANAPKEVTEFAFETDNLTGILDYFHEVAEKCLNGTSQETKGKKEKLIRNVKFQCGTVLKGVEDLRSRFSKLVRRDTKSFNWVERVRWLFDKPNVTELRLNIRFAMTFVSTLTSVLSLDESVSKGEANSLKVRMLKIKLQNSRVMIQTMRLEIEKHRQSHRVPDSSDISSPSFDILNETEDLQKQVENALHNYAKSQVTQRSTPVKQRGTSRPPGFVVPIPVPGRNSEQESRRQSDLEGNVEHHFHYPDGSVNVTKNGQAVRSSFILQSLSYNLSWADVLED
ncbi:hypothetical protein F5Y16DRAFT_201725 [Xylariaceae sp. FL0255]|nr:hypothetical protein F5Y16DRAFT_201725 [Xylariaceae sp. FL0255]